MGTAGKLVVTNEQQLAPLLPTSIKVGRNNEQASRRITRVERFFKRGGLCMKVRSSSMEDFDATRLLASMIDSEVSDLGDGE